MTGFEGWTLVSEARNLTSQCQLWHNHCSNSLLKALFFHSISILSFNFYFVCQFLFCFISFASLHPVRKSSKGDNLFCFWDTYALGTQLNLIAGWSFPSKVYTFPSSSWSSFEAVNYSHKKTDDVDAADGIVKQGMQQLFYTQTSKHIVL